MPDNLSEDLKLSTAFKHALGTVNTDTDKSFREEDVFTTGYITGDRVLTSIIPDNNPSLAILQGVASSGNLQMSGIVTVGGAFRAFQSPSSPVLHPEKHGNLYAPKFYYNTNTLIPQGDLDAYTTFYYDVGILVIQKNATTDAWIEPLFIDCFIYEGLTANDTSSGSNSGEVNTGLNVNSSGIGVFKQKTGEILEFRGIDAASNKLSVSLNGGANTIEIDIDESNFAGIPQSAVTDLTDDLNSKQQAIQFRNENSPIGLSGQIHAVDVRGVILNATESAGVITISGNVDPSLIDHQDLLNSGVYTHAQIDNHINSGEIHRSINDSGNASIDLWSAARISGVIENTTNLIKSSFLSGSVFVGTPRTASVSFISAFPDANYTVNIIGNASRQWRVENQTSSGFTINSNANGVVTGLVYWDAIYHGETLPVS